MNKYPRTGFKAISLSFETVGMFKTDDRIEVTGQTTKKTRAENGWNVNGGWSDCTHYVRKCFGSVGNFDRSPNTDKKYI
jgi:hypothetical protein